jgi:hypothetical protein
VPETPKKNDFTQVAIGGINDSRLAECSTRQADVAEGTRFGLGRQRQPSDDSVIMMRAGLRRASLWLAVMAASGCSTVEPGGNPQIAQVVYDDEFFYCQVQPNVLVAKSCATGDPAMDTSGGCHASATSFRVLPLGANDMVTCDASGKRTGNVSQVAGSNYGAAQAEMTPNAETAPLFTHPTQKTSHPRQIFDPASTEADIIREWARRSSR